MRAVVYGVIISLCVIILTPVAVAVARWSKKQFLTLINKQSVEKKPMATERESSDS